MIIIIIVVMDVGNAASLMEDCTHRLVFCNRATSADVIAMEYIVYVCLSVLSMHSICLLDLPILMWRVCVCVGGGRGVRRTHSLRGITAATVKGS